MLVQPFRPVVSLQRLRDAYPAAADIAKARLEGGYEARLAIARLWMSEGIPYAFLTSPALYEAVRTWVASRLVIEPKEITLTGSARLGQSLSPARLGAPFSDKSDLDFATVSPSLFDRLTRDFNSWANDYEDRRITPENNTEENYWRDHLTRGPQIIGRGFIDSKMIPLRAKYVDARLVADTMYVLREKLMLTAGAPQVRYASIRAYRDWGCFARQFAR